MTEKAKQNLDKIRNNILKAVSDIVKEEGYTGLFIRNIARKANTSGKMIYYHFGTLDHLIETYIIQKDYWRVFSSNLDAGQMPEIDSDPLALIKNILQTHFLELEKNEEMQKIITWEISQYSDILRKEADLREAFGEAVFKRIDPLFDDREFDFRSASAIVVAGIYYLVLHGKVNGSLFCGRDVNEATDKERFLKTINQLMDMCFEKVKKKAD